METPSSTTKRVTRSQTVSSLNNSNIPISSRKIEDSGKGISKSRRRSGNGNQQDRSALIDITNDSPIIGLAMGNLETPSSAIAKQRSNKNKISNTPGSGEALLRYQVKTLLQKVEEEAEVSKISLENRPFKGFVNSPMGILAPTPANTPQIPNLDDSINNKNGSDFGTPLLVIQEQLKIGQVVSEESIETEKSLTRSLLLDFLEKSEISEMSSSSECSSVVTSNEWKTDDESGSNWSVQVNASIHGEEEEEDDDGEEEEEYEGGGLIDELCEGIGNIRFEGKHKKFEYNSDDEMVEEVKKSPSVLHLKGLPTPKGKHLRFSMEEEA